jgi:Fuc2NAc and GlcNAc transferase
MAEGDIIFSLCAAALSGLFAYGLCILAIRSGVALDEVSERSNHKVPVPRIGGTAVLVASGAGVTVLFATALVPSEGLLLLAFAVAAGLVGILDDLTQPPAWVKFMLLAGLACGAALFLGGPEKVPLPFLGWSEIPPFIGLAIAAFWLVAIVNIVNFMDGLNGLIGSFAVLALLAGSMIAAGLAPALLVVQAAVLGFLLCNVFRGSIFLGDSGSLSLGFLIGGLPLLEGNGGVGFWLMPLATLPLIADAALTLVRRAARGARLTEPHREHIYQRLKAYGWSHQAVSTAMLASGAAALTIAFALRGLCEDSAAAYWLTALFIALFWGSVMAAMLTLKTRRLGLEGAIH